MLGQSLGPPMECRLLWIEVLRRSSTASRTRSLELSTAGARERRPRRWRDEPSVLRRSPCQHPGHRGSGVSVGRLRPSVTGRLDRRCDFVVPVIVATIAAVRLASKMGSVFGTDWQHDPLYHRRRHWFGGVHKPTPVVSWAFGADEPRRMASYTRRPWDGAMSGKTIPGFVYDRDLIAQAAATQSWLTAQAKRDRRSRNGWRVLAVGSLFLLGLSVSALNYTIPGIRLLPILLWTAPDGTTGAALDHRQPAGRPVRRHHQGVALAIHHAPRGL